MQASLTDADPNATTGLAPQPVQPLHPTWTAPCMLARLHHISADPAALMHERGLSAHTAVDDAELSGAARQLGHKARISRTSADRLSLAPLPALARLRAADGVQPMA